LPACTEPRFDIHGSSFEIDRRVRETVADSISVYRVFPEILQQLQPDLIVTQSHCQVCAVSERDVNTVLLEWVGVRPMVVSMQPNNLADLWHGIRQVAEAARVPERGEGLIDQLQKRMQAISDRANHWGKKPTVACIEWIDPLMVAGNWMPELVEMAGGSNLFGAAGQHAPNLTWEELVRQDPEVIVVMPCGLDLDRTKLDMPILASREEWRCLRAVQNGRVFIADGNAYFNRPGPRLVESLEMLAEAVVPGAFTFGHHGIETYCA